MHILIASNNTPHGQTALEYGLGLAKQSKATCTLVHVIKRPEERSGGLAVLQMQVEQAHKLGLKPGAELRLGLPAEQIVHLAYEANVDLIVMGGGTQEKLLSRLIAPASERVLANAPCPVLMVRGAARLPQRFLVLHSGAEALRTLPLFLQRAGDILLPGSQVVLLHVMSQIGASHQVSGWELYAEADELIRNKTLEGEWLEQGLAFFEPYPDVTVTPKVRHGLVVDEILAEVRQGDYDLVVLGSHRGGTWQDLLIDNVAKQIAGRTQLPILVVQRQV